MNVNGLSEITITDPHPGSLDKLIDDVLAKPAAYPKSEATEDMIKMLRAAAAYYDGQRSAFCAGKGDTCRDMAAKLVKFGAFASDKQAEFAGKLVLWAKVKPAAEQAAAPAPVVAAKPANELPVPNLFTVMQKHSAFHAGELKISRRNQDSLCWLAWGGACIGKIENGVAVVFGVRARTAGTSVADVLVLLAEFEEAPLQAAMKYGKLSGRCCSCGRDLTDPASIVLGIGPICATKF